MSLPVVPSKVHGRPRSIRDCEPGLPNSEIVLNGERVDLCSHSISVRGSPLRLRARRKMLHWKPLRLIPSLLELYSSSFNLPSHYNPVGGKGEVKNLNVDWLIIGGGTAGLSLLRKVGGLLVSRELMGDAWVPWMDPSLLSQLKETSKSFSEHILIGEYKGKFDEGLAIQSGQTTFVVRAKNVAFTNGSRFVPPLFPGNDLPGVASLRLYLRNRAWFNKPVFVGSSDDILRAASLVGGKVIHRKGAAYFSPPAVEDAQRKGVEVIPAEQLVAHGTRRVKSVEVDRVKIEADSIIYGTVRQPRLEAIANFGLPYVFYSKSHVYLPKHDLMGKAGESLVLGGARGISDPFTSALSAEAAVGDPDQFLSLLREREPHLLDYYRGQWSSSPSPYLLGKDGYVCECEDITYSDVRDYMSFDQDVEFAKRAAGVCTGSCQGKHCAFMLGSILESASLITFRSPLTPLVIP